eukprot:CAMPEP_0201641742 /NCGR_PEP_ID=MMETSP0493-20130528/24801_1 /ASSEMBLY_ACC=CAM_ASM_000838 /TAXON_ID=420259 /ORGANISM="Thalassiosira gravida, Strain GMp14c1" /LENGTH=763 /DNA_ID=CAMNT_0048115733 /DNA_START=170 /DNA_END=2460 /DNA_ORIENTATION=-
MQAAGEPSASVSPTTAYLTPAMATASTTADDGSATMATDGEKGPSQNSSQNYGAITIANQPQRESEQDDDGGEPKETHYSAPSSSQFQSQSMLSAEALAVSDVRASALLATAAAARRSVAAEQQQQHPNSISSSYHAGAFLAAAAQVSIPSSSSGISPAAAVAAVNSPSLERRGSGFLLLAAEAYEAAERTQLRADAIRQVAMELASAAAAETAAASSSSRSSNEGSGGAAVAGESSSFQLQQGLQRHYEDARFSQGGQQASSFLQGLAGSGQQQQHQQQQSMYSNYAHRSSYPEVDGKFRDQVYMAAARMQLQQQQQQQEAQVMQAQTPATQTQPQYKEKEPSPSPQERPKRRKRRSSVGSTSMKIKYEPTCEPPLPPASLVPPTKQPSFEKSRSDVGGGAKDDTAESAGVLSNLLPSGKPRPKPLKHVYHDYASIPDSDQYVRKKTGGVTMPFPEKLMHMLDKESVLHPHIISWQSHGRAFMVRHPKKFTSEVMGGYFRQSKLTSFQRQLNLYGFRRITQGADAGAYYHELFLRGRALLCNRMQRQKVKGTGHKQPTDVTSEPNFYVMSPVIAEAERGGCDAASTEDASGSSGCVGRSVNETLLPPVYTRSKGVVQHLTPHGGTALQCGNFERPVSSLAAPASPQPISMQAEPYHNPYNSPGILAATMLRRLSSSNVGPLPAFSLDGNSRAVATANMDNVSATFSSSKVQHGFHSTLGSCANATAAAAAMTAMGNGSDHGSSRNTPTSSSLGEDRQKTAQI